MITNPHTGTNVQEIAADTYRINTPVELPGGVGWFSFNQYLLVDEEPLLFHTGPRKMFPLVREAIGHIVAIDKLRFVGMSHCEADECGALNDLLARAPHAEPLCGHIAAMVSMADLADRAPRALADGESLPLGRHTLRWFDTPHLPHGWDSGLLLDLTTKTLFCSDLLTQPGRAEVALTTSDILAASEALRQSMDYFAHTPDTLGMLKRLADAQPKTLACMHGSAWQGDGAALLTQLGAALSAGR